MKGSIQYFGEVGGSVATKTILPDGQSQIGIEATLPKGYAGTLSTRTDNDTGVLTLVGEHGFEVNNLLDVYWGAAYRRRMRVTAVTGQLVTVDAGTGTNLPAQGDPIVAAKQVVIHANFNGWLLNKLVIVCPDDEMLLYITNPAGAQLVIGRFPAGEPYVYLAGVNALADKFPTRFIASQGATTADRVLKAGIVLADYSAAQPVTIVYDISAGTVTITMSEDLDESFNLTAAGFTIGGNSKALDLSETSASISGKVITLVGVIETAEVHANTCTWTGLDGLKDATGKRVARFDDVGVQTQA